MIRYLLLTLLSLTTFIVQADVQINITGEIYSPPCTINNGENIIIDFKNINIETVDNTSGGVTKTINIKCSYTNGFPRINVIGNKLEGQNNVLATNITNFGIALFQGTGPSPIRLGEGNNRLMTGIGSSTFTFTSVPFKNGSGTLSPGAFKATARMNIFYE